MTSRFKDVKCLFCKKADKHDHGWEECAKCGTWAHTKCSGVDDSEDEWICPKCVDSDILLKVPGRMTRKSGANSDSGTVPGSGPTTVQTEKQLAAEQRAEQDAFAKQMALRKKRLAEKLAWSEQRMKEEAEMQEQELKAQQEIEKRQLAHDQKMLERQLASEKEYLKKRAALKKQIDASKAKVTALKAEKSPKEKVADWLKGGGTKPKPNYTPESSEEEDDEEEAVLEKKDGKDGPGCSVTRITREQMAARKVVSQALPKFRGEPEVWPLFISSFEHTTAACGFSNLENLTRLMESLEGDALENVRSRLVYPDAVPDIIQDLRDMFGRPEKLMRTLLAKVRNAPAPRADRLDTFFQFGVLVKQLCDHLEAAKMHDHLCNPMLVQELIEKLPPSYRLDWVRFKRNKKESPLRVFGNFMRDIVADVSEVAEFSSPNLNDQSRSGKGVALRRESVHLHEMEQTEAMRSERPSKHCWICKRTDHFVRLCDDFNRMNVVQRLEEVKRLSLCNQCLGKHGTSPCHWGVRCTVPNCAGNHHPLLHRVEETVQLQRAEAWGRSVIFRMMPVTLHAGKRKYDTVAFLDEGSSATLLDDAVANHLRAKGVPEPLVVTWTGDINRVENGSRKVDLMLSAKGSTEKFPLVNTRTVGELMLPRQDVNYPEVVKKFPHLSGIPLQDLPSDVPTILIGLDNLHLFAPLESRIGKPSEPIAVRSKVGWTIYGAIKCKPSTKAILNLHTATSVRKHQPHDAVEVWTDNITPSGDGDRMNAFIQKPKMNRTLREEYGIISGQAKYEDDEKGSVSVNKKRTEETRDGGDDCEVWTKPNKPPRVSNMGGGWKQVKRSLEEVFTALDDGVRLANEMLQISIQESDGGEEKVVMRGAKLNPSGTFPELHSVAALRDVFQCSQRLTSAMWERWIGEHRSSLNRWASGFDGSRWLERGAAVGVTDGDNQKSWIPGPVNGQAHQAWMHSSSGRYQRTVAVSDVREGNPQPEADSQTGLQAGECSDNTATESVKVAASRKVTVGTALHNTHNKNINKNKSQ